MDLPLSEIGTWTLRFLRTLLRSILGLVLKDEAIWRKFGVEALNFELERLAFSEDETIDFGGDEAAELSIPTEFATELTKKTAAERRAVLREAFPSDPASAKHTEDTLFRTIVRSIQKIENPVALLVDDLDAAELLEGPVTERTAAVAAILEVGRRLTAASKLILVFSLSSDSYQKLSKTRTDGRALKGDSVAPLLRFVFFTGVSRFSRVSIFSDLNNPTDLTLSDDYASLLGSPLPRETLIKYPAVHR
ncbi:MAG: AAA family ATPase [Proteobacteria bacterium]|nr:AAA family ATPase [Pseudomonadota bacterium]